MEVSLDLTLDWERAVAELAAVGERRRVERALKRALRKLSRWAWREMTRRYARETGVTQKALRGYRRVSLRVGDMRTDVWAGLDPLPAHVFGRVSWRRNAPGARVRGRVLEGAFYRPVYGTQPKVWIRTARNLRSRLPLYNPPRNWRPMEGGPDRGRFPVALVALPVEAAARPLARGMDRAARERFARLARQELQYALEVEGRR